ncbi:MAG: dihydroorotase family protein [Candidatus Peribacteraceae bacterium]|nr:dihydroorotase family protein [Candidatus Peribacteraceae bacterium]
MRLLLPGLIDGHVHLREPGLTHKGDMETETRSALAGGVTTVCDMPNTVPPTVTVDALRDKVERAERITDCDIRFFFGVTKPEHLEELWRAAADARLRPRLCGVKCFLDHSTGNQGVEENLLEEAFKSCAELGLVAACHCEDPAINARAKEAETATDIATHSRMRPPTSEAAAVRSAITLAREHGTKLHIAHLSTRGGLALVRAAKGEGVSVTCEAAPHHLFLTVDDYAVLGAFGKMNPPLRTGEDRDALWAGIADGAIDCIATDHAPHMREEKQAGDPLSAPSGVPGVETMLPLLLTVAAGGWPHPSSQRPDTRLAIEDIVRLCFENPNRIFHLGRKEGDVSIEVDPEKEWVIHGKDLHAKCGWTPYEGWRVKGKVTRVVR